VVQLWLVLALLAEMVGTDREIRCDARRRLSGARQSCKNRSQLANDSARRVLRCSDVNGGWKGCGVFVARS